MTLQEIENLRLAAILAAAKGDLENLDRLRAQFYHEQAKFLKGSTQ